MGHITYSALPAWLRVMRPEQWTKNGVVLAALFFAYLDPSQGLETWCYIPALRALGAFVSFCLASSGVYVFNDLCDKVADCLHPIKRLRPIASGEISPNTARALAATLVGVSLAAATLLSTRLTTVIALYVVMQYFYTLRLKHIAMLDVFVISIGFVLRAIAGAVVLGVRVSPWLLLCTFLLALFLALCKRRQEKVTKAEAEQRATLKGYSVPLLNQLIAISASATVVSYALYTLSPDTIERFGTPLMGLTIPFVVFGIFRYIHLVYVCSEGERPERTLLTDAVLIVTVFLFLASVAALHFWG